MASFPRREAHQSLYDYFVEVETWLFVMHKDEVPSFIQLSVNRANQRLSVTLGKDEPTLEEQGVIFPIPGNPRQTRRSQQVCG